MSELLKLTSQIVAGYVAKNPVKPDQLPRLITSVFDSKAGHPAEEAETKGPAVPVKKSVFNDHLVCLECGGNFKVLKRHLQTDHGFSIERYRERFSLPREYPIVAPDYAAMRSTLAKEIGLGAKGRVDRKTRRKRA